MQITLTGTLRRPRVAHTIEGTFILYDLMAGQPFPMSKGAAGGIPVVISIVEALVEQRFDETKAAKYSILIRTRTA